MIFHHQMLFFWSICYYDFCLPKWWSWITILDRANSITDYLILGYCWWSSSLSSGLILWGSVAVCTWMEWYSKNPSWSLMMPHDPAWSFKTIPIKRPQKNCNSTLINKPESSNNWKHRESWNYEEKFKVIIKLMLKLVAWNQIMKLNGINVLGND